ncbi:hypothetical protein QCA50_014217 [Cerrena zonata]|uniref:Uncharacterized protein n=1 Tax=Cerrena zonata TaxID=2478898 RepID=A0AAW0FYW6_9APHY
MKEVVLLYDNCPEFVYLECDRVPKPDWEPIPPANFSRDAPAVAENDTTPSIPRQFFRLYEEVHILPGLTKRIEINGAQVWDDEAKVALYESATAMGVIVWKLKKFEEVEGENGKKATKITENIYGKCSWWLKSIVQNETRRGHKDAHGRLSHTTILIIHSPCHSHHTTHPRHRLDEILFLQDYVHHGIVEPHFETYESLLVCGT